MIDDCAKIKFNHGVDVPCHSCNQLVEILLNQHFNPETSQSYDKS